MSEDTTTHRSSPLALLAHPLVLAAVVITAVNDHIFKGSDLLPGVITGKLSDVTGLFFFPILLAVLFYLATWAITAFFDRGKPERLFDTRLLIDIGVVLTIVVFSALNLSETANRLAEPYWGVITMDATDLLCLPMAIVARQFARRRWPRPWLNSSPQPAPFRLRWHHLIALAAACFVSLATSPPPEKPILAYPTWEISPRIDCHDGIEITAWFAKSGKEGAGLAIRLDDSTEELRNVAIEQAKMLIRHSDEPSDKPSLTVEAHDIPAAELDDQATLYIPFLFDNNSAWNNDLRAATVEVDLTIDDSTISPTYRAHHRRADWSEDYHRHRAYLEDFEAAHGKPHMERDGEYAIHDSDAPGGYRILLDHDLLGGCPGGNDD